MEFVTTQVITNSPEIVRYIQKEFAIQYTISGVTKLLHRLGFVYKQVVEIPGKFDNIQAYEDTLRPFIGSTLHLIKLAS